MMGAAGTIAAGRAARRAGETGDRQLADLHDRLTPSQRGALAMVMEGPLFRSRGGWSARGRGCVTLKTMAVLVSKGCAFRCLINTPNSARTFNVQGVRITALGRRLAQLTTRETRQ